jgi:outer membrane cobalamin receptor
MQPARAFASASILSMYSPAFNPELSKQNSWQAGLRAGSFGYWQGFGGASFALPKQTFLSVFAEGVTSQGDYPITIQNGNIVENTKRSNAALHSLQGEVNFAKKFNDSSTLQIKGFTYDSKRGLPGAIIFFNDRSTQQLYNQDYFAQARYNNQFSTGTSLLVSGKFNHTYTRYVDPDFLNNTGGLNDEYRQNEGYLSAAAKQEIGHYFSASFAADAAYTTLGANKKQFVNPKRFSAWSNGMLAYTDSLWKIQASVLWSHFYDRTDTSTQVKNKFTPTISVSRKLSARSPFLLRAFYKDVYRMPTFNDLYYNFIGNANLRPELARQLSVGVTYSHSFQNSFVKQFNISVDGYVNRIKDKIIAVPGQNLFSWTMLNLGKVDIKGIDLTTEINGHIAHTVDWTTRIAYTYQQAKDITDPSSSKYNNRIPYSPDNSGSGMVSFGYKTWNLGYSIVFSGTRYSLGENSPYTELDGWATQDVFASKLFSINKIKCTVKAEANNITNQQYDVVRYYPMPGRSYKISLTINK